MADFHRFVPDKVPRFPVLFAADTRPQHRASDTVEACAYQQCDCCHGLRSHGGELFGWSLRTVRHKSSHSRRENLTGKSLLLTSQQFNFHDIYSLATALFLVRRVRFSPLLRPSTSRTCGQVHQAQPSNATLSPYIRPEGRLFRRYTDYTHSKPIYALAQPISPLSSPTPASSTPYRIHSDYSALGSLSPSSSDTSAPRRPPEIEPEMLSKIKSFALRLQGVIARLPQLWASTSTANDSYAASFAPDNTLPGGYVDSLESRNRRLFDVDKLGIPQHQREMFLAVNKLVLEYMYGDQYDPSHDYEHIQRVVKYTHELYVEEKNAGRVSPNLDITTMYLGAMMHDVGETKYLEKGRTQEEVVVEKMLECGASFKLAHDVAKIAVNVSFTREFTAVDRTLIHAIIEHHPELAFVQDADRLDAIGPSGQARCFVYGGANPGRRQQTIHTGIQLHHKRFQYYVPLMKTRAGRAKAEKKWAWMENHRREWHEDTDVSSVL